MTLHEALEATKIHSVAGKLGPDAHLISKRPYWSPHHTISDVVFGGGVNIAFRLQELSDWNLSHSDTITKTFEDVLGVEIW